MRNSIAKRRSQGIVAVSTLHSLWRQTALERDGGKCFVCGSTDKVNVHHIINAKNKSTRYDVNNAICLCSTHHKFSYEISAHSNPLVFYDFMRKKDPDRYQYIIEYDDFSFDDDWNRVYEELKSQK